MLTTSMLCVTFVNGQLSIMILAQGFSATYLSPLCFKQIAKTALTFLISFDARRFSNEAL